MEGIVRRCGPRGGFLVGVDLWKSAAILEPAYDDAAGMTATFNKNLLVRINRELDSDFDLDQFEHRAVVNERCHRVEMHLVSRRRQSVRTSRRQAIRFAAGETICTEHSNKFTLEAFRDMARTSGRNDGAQVWMDDERLFSVQYLEVARVDAVASGKT